MELISAARIEKMIYLIRGQRVMLDTDLSLLYGVTTSNLNKAVNRNINRFPSDFIFQLTQEEFETITFKEKKHGGRRFLPYVFTEGGVAMLSGVLHSQRAINVNISIMRTFIKLRQFLAADETLADKLYQLEKGTNQLFRVVFERLDSLEKESPILPVKRKKIGIKS